MTVLPVDDGIAHINIYSRGRTLLGRMLSNFTYMPFTHPKHGVFSSIEAYYYWISTGKCHEELRNLHGYAAKEAGKKLTRVPCDNFQDEITLALRLKVMQNRTLAHALKDSVLPLAHYYWYGKLDNCKVIELKEHDYMVKALEDIRTELKTKK